MSEIILKRIPDPFVKSTPEKNLEIKIEPPGILGRGSLLKCPEKKVSRNHATIDWDDDGVLITSTHLNPTFVIIKGEEKSLPQGQSAVLRNGDSFGLLKEAYWYKLSLKSFILKGEEERNGVKNNADKIKSKLPKISSENNRDLSIIKNNESKIKEEDEFLSTVSTESKEENYTSTISTESKEENTKSFASDSNVIDDPIEEEKTLIQNLKCEVDDSIDEVSPSFNNRERVLPKWFTNTKASNETDATQKKNKNIHGMNRNKVRNVKTPNVKPKKFLHDISDEEIEERISLKKKATKKASPQKPKKPATSKPNKYHTVSQDIDTPDFDAEDQNLIRDEEDKTCTVTKVNSKTAVLEENIPVHKNDHAISDEESLSEAEKSPTKIKNDSSAQKLGEVKKKKTPRKSCQYGAQCYRQNPAHRDVIAHPGDADYVSVPDNSDDDERPECEFGLNCYRKNPQHKKDFKHTKKPQPQRQAKKKAKREGYEDDDSDNDYDFDDPFLNDDSSDDYAPTDSSDQDSEIVGAAEEKDTKRMLKEAKKFVRKRKYED